MKRKILISVLVLALVLTATLAVLAGCNAKKHTVKFDLGELYTGDVEAPASMQVDDGGEIELPQLPAGVSVADHHFAGWKAANEDEAHAAGAKVTITADVTFIAQWLKDVAHVKFLAEDETVISEKDVEKGAAIGALPEAEAVFGMKFDGWYVKGDADKAKIAESYVVNEDVEFLPIFVEDDNIASVTVKFMIRGTVQSSDKDKTVKLGDAIGEIFPELAELEIQNNELFVGWYLSDGSVMSNQKVEAGKVFIPEGKKVVGIEEANIVRVPASATEIIVEAKIVDLGTAVSESIDSKYVGKWALVEGGASHTVDIAADSVTYTISQDGEDDVVLSAALADVFAAADGLNVKLKDAEEAVHVYHLSVADDKLGFAEYGETAKQLSFMVHVVFEVNGEQHSEQWVVKGSSVELPEDLDVPGMTFEGWHVDGAEDILSGPYTANADVKIVAKLTAKTITEADFAGYWIATGFNANDTNTLMTLYVNVDQKKITFKGTTSDYTYSDSKITVTNSSASIFYASWEISIANGKMTGVATFKNNYSDDAASAHTYEFVRPSVYSDFNLTGTFYSGDGKDLLVITEDHFVSAFHNSSYFAFIYKDAEDGKYYVIVQNYPSSAYTHPVTVENGCINIDFTSNEGGNRIYVPIDPEAAVTDVCKAYKIINNGVEQGTLYKYVDKDEKDVFVVSAKGSDSKNHSYFASVAVENEAPFAQGSVAIISYNDGEAKNIKVKVTADPTSDAAGKVVVGDGLEGSYSFAGSEGGLGDIVLDGYGNVTIDDQEKTYSVLPDGSIDIDGVLYVLDKVAGTYDLKPADELKGRVFNAKHTSLNDYWEITFVDGLGNISAIEWYDGDNYDQKTATYSYDSETKTLVISGFSGSTSYGKINGTFTVDLVHNVLINVDDEMAWLEGVATEAHPDWAYVPASADAFVGYWTAEDSNVWLMSVGGNLYVKMSMETTDYRTVIVLPGGKTMILWQSTYSYSSTDYKIVLDDSDPENLKLSVKKGSGEPIEFTKAGDVPEFAGFVDQFLSGAFETGDGMSLTFEEKTLKIDGTEVSGLFAIDVDYMHIYCKQFHFKYDGKSYYIQKGIYDKSTYRYAQNEYYIFEGESDNGKLLFKKEGAPAIPKSWYGEYNGKLDQNDIKIVIDASGVKFNDKAVSKVTYFAMEARYDNTGHSREGIGFYIAKDVLEGYEGDFALVKDSALGSSVFDYHLYLFMSVVEKRDIDVTRTADAIEEPEGFDLVGIWYFGNESGSSRKDYFLTFSKTAEQKLQVKLNNGDFVDVELTATSGRWKFTINSVVCDAYVNDDGTITVVDSGTYAGTYTKGGKPTQVELDEHLVAIGSDLKVTPYSSSYKAAKSVKIESNKITVVIPSADGVGDTTLTSYSISDQSTSTQIKYYIIMDDFIAWTLYIYKSRWEGDNVEYDFEKWELECSTKINDVKYDMYLQSNYEDVQLSGTYKFTYQSGSDSVTDHMIFLEDGTVAVHSATYGGLFTYTTTGKNRVEFSSFKVDKQDDGKLKVQYSTTLTATAEADSTYSTPNSNLGKVTYIIAKVVNLSNVSWANYYVQKVEINWALMAITLHYSESADGTSLSSVATVYTSREGGGYVFTAGNSKTLYFKLNDAQDTITLYLDSDSSEVSSAPKEIDDPNKALGKVKFVTNHEFPMAKDSLEHIVVEIEFDFAAHSLAIQAASPHYDTYDQLSGSVIYAGDNKYTVKGEDFYLVYDGSESGKTLTAKLVDGDEELGKLYEEGKAPEYVDPNKSLPKTKYTAAQPIDSAPSPYTKFLIKSIEVDWANMKATLGYAYGSASADPAPEDKTLELTLTAKHCYYEATSDASDYGYSKNLDFMLVGSELKVFNRATYLGSAKAAGAEEEPKPTKEHSLYEGIFHSYGHNVGQNVLTRLKFEENGNKFTYINSSGDEYTSTFTYDEGAGTVNVVSADNINTNFAGDYTFDKATGELKHSTGRIYYVLGKDEIQAADLEGKSFAYSPRNFAFKASGEGDYTSTSSSSTFKWEITQNDANEWVVRISENSTVNGDYYLVGNVLIKDSTSFTLVEA